MRIVAVDVLRELLMLSVRGRVKRRRLVVQRRIAAATVELEMDRKEYISQQQEMPHCRREGKKKGAHDILNGLLVEAVQQLVQVGMR